MSSSPHSILFLHGGGSADKHRTDYLQIALNKQSISSFSFDFSGQGESKIPLFESSLQRRVKEAQEAIKAFNLKEPLTLCGSSMGAYIAIKLLEKYHVKNLILFCPAVYDVKAYDVNFGDEFTRILRTKNSWCNTDAFSILSNFTGNALIFIGETDEIIPKELVQKLNESLTNTKHKELIKISDCPHAMHTFLANHPPQAQLVADKIINLVNCKKSNSINA